MVTEREGRRIGELKKNGGKVEHLRWCKRKMTPIKNHVLGWMDGWREVKAVLSIIYSD